ncbi:hypothetical protein A1Q2_05122 [Trichosporon asahii var. asahii CBS 8904]|uniref:Uncharacterized protein n=2 Tax=Trichosporon asahii var. asahii TaxID=189963 RepID=K1VMH7_TRIAC|nr:hypothetical protein A1Q1_06544 [Trichosporon asahii var. asahii CBS 2479]EJT45083.1 hypothetical protein A1Q1_06544 [Trichosporon asahii var. asahii CBS 2479]EKD00572.1 hypothetical protein A1Q2_05122 [Trichosporon asahii var. asahii CBS 8904]
MNAITTYLQKWIEEELEHVPYKPSELFSSNHDHAAAFCAKILPPSRTEHNIFVRNRHKPIARIARSSEKPSGFFASLSPPPYLFTTFYYTTSQGMRTSCSRSDLCQAYATLQSDLDDTYRRLSALRDVYALPFASAVAGPMVRFESTFGSRVRELERRCEAIMEREEWALDLFASYLAHLQHLETYGTLPQQWREYLGLDAEMVRLPHARESIWLMDGMDDYVFRAARLINTSSLPPEVRRLHRDLRQVAQEMMAQKGYAACVIERLLPPSSEKRRPQTVAPPAYEPPPPYSP